MLSITLSAAALALAAFACEAALGYSQALYRRIGHPVTWMGFIIMKGDGLLNREHLKNVWRFSGGTALLLFLVLLSGSMGLAISMALTLLPFGFAAEVLLASTLVASRSLAAHISDVAAALEEKGITAGREAVSRVVGRDVSALQEHGIARAAIESLAENFSDGVTAPLFWCAIGGLPGLLIYKAVNTADSMIGHRNARYEYFGKAAAHLDDVMNYLPARLTGALIAAAALAIGTARASLRTASQDARKHLSPNAGWPEAAMAGALGLRLGGPRRYGERKIEGVWLGNGRENAAAKDIRSALRLYRLALLLLAALLALLVLWTGATR